MSVFLGGCSGEIAGVSGPGTDDDVAGAGDDVTDFDRAMMEIASSYKTFTRINAKPYPSTLGAFDINVYVRGDAREYRGIHPDTAGTSSIDVGTIIVREVLDANGRLSKLTLMAKGPRDYDPSLGDWWFAELGAVGRLIDCHSCHIPRAGDDYLFGVPREAQRP